MFGLHAWDLLLVLLLILLFFGARRLPELGSSFGKSFNLFHRGLNGPDQPIVEGKKEHERAQLPEPVTVKESER